MSIPTLIVDALKQRRPLLVAWVALCGVTALVFRVSGPPLDAVEVMGMAVIYGVALLAGSSLWNLRSRRRAQASAPGTSPHGPGGEP